MTASGSPTEQVAARAAEAIAAEFRRVPWMQRTYDELFADLAEAAIAALALTEEWAATCDQWSAGRMVRSTRLEAEQDAVKACERVGGPYSMLEPPPPSIDDMRLEQRVVGPWVPSVERSEQ